METEKQIKNRHTMKTKNPPEIYPSFWLTPGTKEVGNCIFVKRFTDGNEDNVYILRVNYKIAGSRFKFPSFFMEILITHMENLLERLNDDDESWRLDWITVNSYKDLTTDLFWSGQESLKIQRFNFSPYLSEYGIIKFRLWNEVEKEHHKIYKDHGDDIEWRGDASSIGLSDFKELLKALKELRSENAETNQLLLK